MKKRLLSITTILILAFTSITVVFASDGGPPPENQSWTPIEIPCCETECDC